MNTHERDGNFLSRLMSRRTKVVSKGPGVQRAEKRESLKASRKMIDVKPQYVSLRAVKRRAMRKEIVAECKKLGVTWKQAKRYMREELKQKPTLNAMHREMVGGEPC